MKKIKKFLAVVLVASMMVVSSVSVFAAEPLTDEDQVFDEDLVSDEDEDEGIMPLNTDTFTLGLSYTYHTVYYNFKDGGKLRVEVSNFEPKKYQMDIILGGRNGTLWQEKDCLHNESSRTFDCGSDVTNFSLRIIPRATLFPAPTKAFTTTVIY